MLLDWRIPASVRISVFFFKYMCVCMRLTSHSGPIHATTSQLYTTLLVVAVPLGIFASPISTVLWLIGASGTCILAHASFMDKPIENAFSEEAV